jgi:pimeloyl-ACP methyl ester carboxylesterase
MRGAQSNVLAEDIAQRAAETLPNGRLVTVDPATHNVHSDNPTAFARELHTFLGAVL